RDPGPFRAEACNSDRKTRPPNGEGAAASGSDLHLLAEPRLPAACAGGRDRFRDAAARHRAIGSVPEREGRPSSLERSGRRIVRGRDNRRAGGGGPALGAIRSEEHTSELQSRENLVCRLLLEKKKSHRQ